MRREEAPLPADLSVLGQLGRVYLTLPEDYTIDQWLEAGAQLLHVRDRAQFLLGDLLLEGMKRFGEQHSQLFDQQNIHTLRKCEWVCKRVPPDVRVPDLSFSHHDAVAKLEPEDQRELLMAAKERRWDRDKLREAVDKRREERDIPKQRRPATAPPSEPEIIPPRPLGPTLVKAADIGRREEPEQPAEPEAPLDLPPEAEAQDAVTYLYGLSRISPSQDLRKHLTTVLHERDSLMRLLQVARRAVEIGQITPELQAAVR